VEVGIIAKRYRVTVTDIARQDLEVLALLGDVSGRRVLDAGCGAGALAVALLQRDAVVTGLVLGERMAVLYFETRYITETCCSSAWGSRTGHRADWWSTASTPTYGGRPSRARPPGRRQSMILRSHLAGRASSGAGASIRWRKRRSRVPSGTCTN
jgi:hypothetical protein